MKAVSRSYLGRATLLPWIELLFGAYFSAALWFAVDSGIYTSVPFLVLFQVGFLYVGLGSLWASRPRPAGPPPAPLAQDSLDRAA